MPPKGSLAPRTGNAYDKYGSTHPVERRLVAGFLRGLDELWSLSGGPAAVSRVDVGCGEGRITAEWARRAPQCQVVGLDRASEPLSAAWARHALPNLRFVTGDAGALPFADGEFAAASAIELLEQVTDPDAVLAELLRVSRGPVILSVPREPVWRVLNVGRGRYLKWLGNPPGHIHHFSRGAFLRLVGRHGEVAAVRTPFPWTMALVRPPG